VLVPEEKHHRDGIVQLVHLLEVWHLVEVTDVDDGEVLDAVGDFVEDFVLAHAVGVPVAAEADYHEPVFFGHYGLVDVPAGYEVGNDDGAHGCCSCFGVEVELVVVVREARKAVVVMRKAVNGLPRVWYVISYEFIAMFSGELRVSAVGLNKRCCGKVKVCHCYFTLELPICM
jgi:hypothetical protein